LEAEEQARLAAAEASASSSPAGAAKMPRQRRSNIDRSASTPVIETAEGGRPMSPSTHTKRMTEHAAQKIEVMPVSMEHHRKMYYPRSRLGLIPPLGTLPPGIVAPKVVTKYPAPETKKKRWGPLVSDYGKAGDIVEKGWIMRRIQGTLSEPMLGSTKTHIEGIPGKLCPSIDSPACAACMTGGTTMSLRATSRIPKNMQRTDQRQLGLYEDSFRIWRGDYAPPKHGLNTTDVTSFADEMVTQKALMRK